MLTLFYSPGFSPLEGLQPVVQQSTICPSGSRALRSQTWLRKIDLRNCVEWLITEYIDAISCVDFAKPCLASQSSSARRVICRLLHYCLEPFNFRTYTVGPLHVFYRFPLQNKGNEAYFAVFSQMFN